MEWNRKIKIFTHRYKDAVELDVNKWLEDTASTEFYQVENISLSETASGYSVLVYYWVRVN